MRAVMDAGFRGGERLLVMAGGLGRESVKNLGVCIIGIGMKRFPLRAQHQELHLRIASFINGTTLDSLAH